MWLKNTIERVKSSDVALRLASGAFWSIIGNVAGRGLTLLAFIFVARIIGQKQYGELGMIRSTMIMFSSFAGAGIGLTASRYIALHRNTNTTKTNEVYFLSHYFSVVFGLIIAVLLCFFAPTIAVHSLHAPYLTNDIRLGAVALLFMALNNAQIGALSGFERFRSIAINTTIYGVLQLLFLVVGALYYAVSGVIIGMTLSSLVFWLCNYYAIRASIPKGSFQIKPWKTISKDTISVLWKFSLPATMSSILVIPILWWCKTIVVQRVGFEPMANYDVAEQWNTIILFIPATLSGMIMPILANTLMEGTPRQYQKVVTINIWINAVISVFASLFICLLTTFILKSYGATFTDTFTFRILVLSTIPNAIAAVLGQVIASKGKMWAGFFLNFLWAIWLLLFTFLFVGYLGYGTSGLALAVLCAYVLHLMFSYAYMWARVLKNEQ